VRVDERGEVQLPADDHEPLAAGMPAAHPEDARARSQEAVVSRGSDEACVDGGPRGVLQQPEAGSHPRECDCVGSGAHLCREVGAHPYGGVRRMSRVLRRCCSRSRILADIWICDMFPCRNGPEQQDVTLRDSASCPSMPMSSTSRLSSSLDFVSLPGP
jgi:hypothetical protein